jgi:hypothetical protein
VLQDPRSIIYHVVDDDFCGKHVVDESGDASHEPWSGRKGRVSEHSKVFKRRSNSPPFQ